MKKILWLFSPLIMAGCGPLRDLFSGVSGVSGARTSPIPQMVWMSGGTDPNDIVAAGETITGAAPIVGMFNPIIALWAGVIGMIIIALGKTLMPKKKPPIKE